MFLLHSNVDRLFAMWQGQPGQEWRLDPDQVYGDQSNTTGAGSILDPMHPWNGTVQFGSPIDPWIGASAAVESKNCRHLSVVRPPCYDTLPLTVEQVSPAAGDPVRFLDVIEHLPTARALRLRVRGCTEVTVTAAVTAPFTVLSASVTSPHPNGFEATDLLIWVLCTPGAAGSADSGTLTGWQNWASGTGGAAAADGISGAHVRLIVQGRTATQVVLADMKVRVVERNAPITGTRVSKGCGDQWHGVG
ncbi:hypothetical protein [Lentzea roselyniae]